MDKILGAYLQRQYEQGMQLDGESDLLELLPLEGPPAPQHYVARFRCKGLVRTSEGEVREADEFLVGVFFPDDYLRRADPPQVLSWLGPRNVFHPNISDRAPFICVGRLAPGTPLVDILYQCFEIITYQKATVREDDALNHDACGWARRNAHRVPVDTRPLKRQQIEFQVEPVEVE